MNQQTPTLTKLEYTSPQITTIEIDVEMGFTASLFEDAEKGKTGAVRYSLDSNDFDI